MSHECDERCIKTGYCPYYVSPPDWCGQPYKHARKRKISHIRIYTGGQPVLGLPFHGELMTCHICGAQHRSNPKEESNWTHFQHRGKEAYLCPGCWSIPNLEKVLRYLAGNKP